MSWGYVAVAGATLVAGYMSSNAQKDAAEDAANAQSGAGAAGIAEQRRQFDAIQELLKPYVTTGTSALSGQQDLMGLNGTDAQKAAIEALQASPQFTSMLKQGENSILSNASATGNLRGGNTQAALSQFSPALLSATINDQYAKLGGLSSMGLGAATKTGAFGQAATDNVTQLLGQIGASQAGAALARGRADSQMWNTGAQAVGQYYGMGGKF